MEEYSVKFTNCKLWFNLQQGFESIASNFGMSSGGGVSGGVTMMPQATMQTQNFEPGKGGIFDQTTQLNGASNQIATINKDIKSMIKNGVGSFDQKLIYLLLSLN